MTDYAIHSPNNGELLIKFHDELVKHGFTSDEKWNHFFNPKKECFTLTVYKFIKNPISYHNHQCVDLETHRDLTPENFNSVLNEVLQNFGINV